MFETRPLDREQVLSRLARNARVRASLDAEDACLLARFAELSPPNRDGVLVADGAAEEVAIETHVSPRVALAKLLQAQELVNRLPATLAALEAGDIDAERAATMTKQTTVLPDDQARWVEQRVLARGPRADHSRFRRAVRDTVTRADITAADLRRKHAREQERGIKMVDLPDGLAQLRITLDAAEAVTAFNQIDALAKQRKTTDRSLKQRMADVFMDMVTGKELKRSAIATNVMVPMTTLIGLTEQPAELSGYGAITADHARELAHDTTWRRILTDPAGHVLDVSRRRFAPPSLKRHIQLRDRTCRQPGCEEPAERTEIDHTTRHADHGPTSVGNLAALCKKHNLLKERSGWTIEQPEPGTLTFTTPSGKTYTTNPEPYELE
ncbi:HNH endonuclease [Kibdelosporangium aridum]|uniref:HNH endonuclease n=1 Tax=Kibdelosporangium aridum TaxID=2030 RepID=A0A428XQV5_KIBAR|nr:HNH endonuclease signature motif containing protein [Kibdelosporangium aridum]RSM57721.1 HNH endonuclease [Kibdelosporangium aridum]